MLFDKEKKQPVLVVLAVLIVLLASVTAGLCVALFTRYTWVAGGIREKGNSRLDLRGETISLSDFEKLTQAFPGREILWDVPLQSGSVASDASQVTLLNPSPSDWEALDKLYPRNRTQGVRGGVPVLDNPQGVKTRLVDTFLVAGFVVRCTQKSRGKGWVQNGKIYARTNGAAPAESSCGSGDGILRYAQA